MSVSIFDHQSVATFLKAVLAERAHGDSEYSLRAMARDIDISPAHLSQIINGKKKLSPQMRLRVAAQLGLAERQTRYFYLLSQLETAPSADIASTIQKQLNDLAHSYAERLVDTDQFKAISDWYHVPILEMSFLDSFRCDDVGVAERLGITVAQAAEALVRLERLGLLRLLPNGAYEKSEQNHVFRTSRRNEAFGEFMRQMMGLAVEAMGRQPVEDRVMMSQTFCVGRSQIDEARDITREYMQRMAGLFDTTPSRESVYQLNIQFFDLTDGRAKDPEAALRPPTPAADS